MAVYVSVQWSWIKIHPNQTWSITEGRLSQAGVDMTKLDRVVYVIRAANDFIIRYPWDHSPTLYIGEGDFRQRITSHREWLGVLYDLAGEFPLEVAVCSPRVPGNATAYKDLEAYLLNAFLQRYGTLPLNNKQNEYERYQYEYDEAAVNEVIGIGRGKRFKWALQPLPSNPFYVAYEKTHAKQEI